jgi:hypothetical protein
MKELKPIDQCSTVTELLADKSRWTQGACAKDENGEAVDPFSYLATCFCVWGAVIRIHAASQDTLFPPAYAKLAMTMTGRKDSPLSRFNDTHTYEEVYAKVLEAGI